MQLCNKMIFAAPKKARDWYTLIEQSPLLKYLNREFTVVLNTLIKQSRYDGIMVHNCGIGNFKSTIG